MNFLANPTFVPAVTTMYHNGTKSRHSIEVIVFHVIMCSARALISELKGKNKNSRAVISKLPHYIFFPVIYLTLLFLKIMKVQHAYAYKLEQDNNMTAQIK
jgi:hypothetical protein